MGSMIIVYAFMGEMAVNFESWIGSEAWALTTLTSHQQFRSQDSIAPIPEIGNAEMG